MSPEELQSQLRAAALAYAERGFRVFPCSGKVPITPHGCLDATTDPARIAAWWDDHPDANVAIATGPDSGVDVVDIDANPAKGKVGIVTFKAILQAQGLEDFDTVTASTPTGGFHLYVKHAQLPNRTNTLGPDVDTRGAGGYVLAPPSIHPDTGTEYEWLADPFSNTPVEAPPWMRVVARSATPPPVAVAWAEPETDSLTEPEVWTRLRGTSGERITVIDRMQAGEPLFDPGTHHAETWKLVSYLRFRLGRRVTDATLLRLLAPSIAAMDCADHGEAYFAQKLRETGNQYGAKQAERDANGRAMLVALGLDKPNVYVKPNEVAADAMARARAELDAHRGKSASTARRGFESVADWLTLDLPKTPWLVRGVLPADGVLVASAEPKCGKTWAVADLAIAIATATNALAQFPAATEPRAVAYFFAEDAQRSVRSRLVALARGREMDPAVALKHVYAVSRGTLDLCDDDELCWLISAVRGLPEAPALLVLDPLRDLHTADENDSSAMARVMGNLRALRDILECSVLFVHHNAKASKDGTGRDEGQRMRGSSVIHGAMDGGLFLTKDGERDEDDVSTLYITARVQLKSARGAGRFVLRLDMEDDAEHEAQVARWSYERKQESVAPNLVDAVVQVCKQKWVQTGGVDGPRVTTREIRNGVPGRGVTIDEAIAKAVNLGRISKVLSSKAATVVGYRYVVQPGDAGLAGGEP